MPISGRSHLILIAVAGVVAEFSQDDGESDPAAIATAIADEWIVAWVASDIDAIAALFTVDGDFETPVGNHHGQDSIRSVAESHAPLVSFEERLGDGVLTETGSFVFPMRFEFGGYMHVGEFEVEVSGDLASRIAWLSWEKET